MRRFLNWLFDVLFAQAADRRIRRQLLYGTLVYGDPSRLSVAKTAVVNNALFNTLSGKIKVEDHAFFGHNVCILTGAHDVKVTGPDRQLAMPCDGHDVTIRSGAWVASNATVIGPCVVGENAVVAAGAVVIRDVPAFSIVGGVPAKTIGNVPLNGRQTKCGVV
jgi:acetyltransferase-like isoleucine patch superfamily enzyme